MPATSDKTNKIGVVCVRVIDSTNNGGKDCCQLLAGKASFHLGADPMPIRTFSPPMIDVSDARFERPWDIDMEAFFTFSFDMSERLLKLEAQHSLPLRFDEDLYAAAAAKATWM